ncbi:MAG: tRNA uridine(34) 5-carboxymethylaminomethyl modification radical SAM/GNAT enzyme Elp3 [Methanobacteriota archaeon]
MASLLLDELVRRLLRGEARTPDEVHRLKLTLARSLRVADLPSNADVLAHAGEAARDRLLPVLRTKATRSLSGVAVVAVMTGPSGCPHGRCTFCPGGVAWDSPEGRRDTPQSYTGHEPAALRGAAHGYDPFEQARGRLAQLRETGHAVDKVDVIVMGGTFPARGLDHQESFVKGIFDALNSHGGEPQRAASLEAAQERNEEAPSRCIGLTIETKPDWCFEPHVAAMQRLGGTRVEIGVQTTHDDVLAATHRGHDTKDAIRATRVAKDAGLKVCYHMMPGLPGSGPERDLAAFDRIFDDADFRPDMLKIYPTLVVPGTPLFESYQRGEYRPYSTDEAATLIARIKERVPEWVRIQRIDRDIPSHQIAAGVTNLNLREIAVAKMTRPCRCIRCREAGHAFRRSARRAVRLDIVERAYDASGGMETFLSFEDPDTDVLAAFARLRYPSDAPWRPEVEGAAIVRELRVVGLEVPIHQSPGASQALQHRGLGRRLMTEAEGRTRDAGYDRLVVTSGVGVRPYYAKLGYRREGPYMAKRLT